MAQSRLRVIEVMEKDLKSNKSELFVRSLRKTEMTGSLIKIFLIYHSLMNCNYSILVIFSNKKYYFTLSNSRKKSSCLIFKTK